MAITLTLPTQRLIGASGIQFEELVTKQWGQLNLTAHIVDLVFRVHRAEVNGVTFLEFVVSDLFPKDAYSHLILCAHTQLSDRVLLHVVHWSGSRSHLILWRKHWPNEAIHVDLDFSRLTEVELKLIAPVENLDQNGFDSMVDMARDPEIRDRFRQVLNMFLERVVDKNKFHQRQAVVDLMLKILFLVFVQRKGWLNSDPNYIQRWMTYSHEKGLSILQCFLKPLFARLEGIRVAEFIPLGNLPRLGGGLFQWDSSYLPLIDNRWLLDFTDTLSARFSFSLIESRPGRTIYGISPEILGHVFENLLNEKQRKRQGVFYTPFALAAKQVRSGFEHLRENHGINAQDPDAMRSFLSELRVLDPSCGSGTFLVASFQCLLDEWLAISPAQERTNGKLYELKKKIVSHHLFGLDINPTAVKLTEVRLWLNMIQDIEVSDPELAPALPNLRHHVRCGDFLFQRSQINLNRLREWPKLKQLQRLRVRFPDSEPQRRDTMLKHMSRLETELQTYLDQQARAGAIYETKQSRSQTCLFDVKRPSDKRIKVSTAWSSQFEPHIVFSEAFMAGGFDLIVGNPPWISGTRIHGEVKKRIRASLTPPERRLLPGNADLSLYFMVMSLRLTKRKGHIGFVLPGKFMQAKYALPLRNHLARQLYVNYVSDHGVRQGDIFKADTFPIALGFSHRPAGNPSVAIEIHRGHERVLSRMDQTQFERSVWTLSTNDNCCDDSATLASLECPIRRGVVTNAKRIFTFDTIPQGYNTNHFRPLLSGRDIQPNRCQPKRWIYWPFDDMYWIDHMGPQEISEILKCGKLRVTQTSPKLPYCPKTLKNWILVWKYLATKPVCSLWKDPPWVPDQTTYYMSVPSFETGYRLLVWLTRPQSAVDLSMLAERGKDGCFFHYAHTMAGMPLCQETFQRIPVPEPDKKFYLQRDLPPWSTP